MKMSIINKFFFKRAKKQLFVIIVFLFLSSFLLNLALILVTDYKANFQRDMDKLNCAHIVLNFAKLSDDIDINDIEIKLNRLNGIIYAETLDTVTQNGSCPYGDGVMTLNFSFVRLDDALNCKINKYEILSSSDEDGIYLPYIFYVNDYYKIGDRIEITFGDTKLEYNVKGFYNNLTTGTINCRDISLLVSDSDFTNAKAALSSYTFRVSAKYEYNTDIEKQESKLISDIFDISPNITLIMGTNSKKLSSNRYITESICMGIVVAATIISVTALLTVIVITLSDIVKKNIRNLGALKAMGYVSRKIIVPITLSFTTLTLFFSFVGIALSYAFFPIFNKMLECQVGIPYKLHFMPIPSVISCTAMIVTVLLSVQLSIAKIKRIQPIMAIRRSDGNQKGNKILPLSKSALPLNLSLSIKSTFGSMRRNLVILFSAFLVSLLIGFDCFCFEYIIKNPDGIMLGLFGNMSDTNVIVTEEQKDDLFVFAENDSRVEGIYMYGTSECCHKDGYRLAINFIDDNTAKYNSDICLTGHFPENSDEVAINCYYSDITGLNIGDDMTLVCGTNEYTYTVCGTFQDTSASGRNVILKKEDLDKISESCTLTYSLLLSDETDVNEFNKELDGAIHPLSTFNYKEYTQTMSSSYISMLTSVSFFVFALSVGIIILILYIIISIMLDNKKREHGIFKALGFGTAQIVFQTSFALMPFGILGTVLGMLVSKNGVCKFLSLMFRSIGMINIGGVISTETLFFSGCGLVLLMFVASCLLSIKVKHIVPHDLFNRE